MRLLGVDAIEGGQKPKAPAPTAAAAAAAAADPAGLVFLVNYEKGTGRIKNLIFLTTRVRQLLDNNNPPSHQENRITPINPLFLKRSSR